MQAIITVCEKTLANTRLQRMQQQYNTAEKQQVAAVQAIATARTESKQATAQLVNYAQLLLRAKHEYKLACEDCVV